MIATFDDAQTSSRRLVSFLFTRCLDYECRRGHTTADKGRGSVTEGTRETSHKERAVTLTFNHPSPLPKIVYLQQILVINLEARRKDYYQMFAHHIITSMLMMSSYVLNWTRIGNTILCTMDLVDITLPVRLSPFRSFSSCSWYSPPLFEG